MAGLSSFCRPNFYVERSLLTDIIITKLVCANYTFELIMAELILILPAMTLF